MALPKLDSKMLAGLAKQGKSQSYLSSKGRQISEDRPDDRPMSQDYQHTVQGERGKMMAEMALQAGLEGLPLLGRGGQVGRALSPKPAVPRGLPAETELAIPNVPKAVAPPRPTMPARPPVDAPNMTAAVPAESAKPWMSPVRAEMMMKPDIPMKAGPAIRQHGGVDEAIRAMEDMRGGPRDTVIRPIQGPYGVIAEGTWPKPMLSEAEMAAAEAPTATKMVSGLSDTMMQTPTMVNQPMPMAGGKKGIQLPPGVGRRELMAILLAEMAAAAGLGQNLHKKMKQRSAAKEPPPIKAIPGKVAKSEKE